MKICTMCSVDEPALVEAAQVELLTKTCADLLAILKRDGGFRTPRQQKTIRAARALLVDLGQRVSGEDV